MVPTDIVVCTTCRPAGASRERPADGLNLLEAVQEVLLSAQSNTDAPLGVRVRGQACMSGCNRACTVAFQAEGKQTYYFGDLVADAETADQVVACAQLHRLSADGSMARNRRPERLRQGILACLPASDRASGRV
jgi:predicted metal-binding protein